MIRDITIGQFYPVESPIHRLDPRVKIIGVMLFLVELFIVDSFLGFLVCAAVIGTVIAVSKVPMHYIMRGLKPIILILVFTFCLNIFMTPGHILWQWKFLRITTEGLYLAAFMSVRLILLIVGASLLTLTTTPIRLTDGIERLLSPLNAVGVHTHEIAMMMSIALRFIPTLMEETDKIIKAQQARGADFESGNIFARARSLVPILVPLFVSAFRIAQDLAMAMEARCYRGGTGRTRMNGMKMRGVDLIWFAGLAVFFALILGLRILF